HPDNELRARERLLLGDDVDVEVGVERVERPQIDVGQRCQRLGESAVDARTAGIRVRVDYADHATRISCPEADDACTASSTCWQHQPSVKFGAGDVHLSMPTPNSRTSARNAASR